MAPFLLVRRVMPATVDHAHINSPLLRRVVAAGLVELNQKLERQEKWLPGFVRREFAGFLSCGDPTAGFAWLVCDACEHHRLVPFSCKGRGFCPACGGRRMAESARRWANAVLPRVAVRQWVVTVPWPRRWLLARRSDLARGVLGVAIAEIQRWTARHGVQPARPGGQTGSVTVIQRFGGALNLNLHFHILVLDGQYAADPRTGVLRWVRARPPTTEEVERLVERVADRAEAWLARRGFRGDEGLEQDSDDVQAAIQAAAVMGRSVLRRGRRARRVQVLGGRPHALPPRCATADGYTVHAGVVIGAKNREGLERLCRYIARPPLAKGRLEENPDGTLRL
ncbi:MAG TPA: transposase, partial [Myxococcota bacterium]|nr:transposase [Myxococcota bacterium]